MDPESYFVVSVPEFLLGQFGASTSNMSDGFSVDSIPSLLNGVSDVLSMSNLIEFVLKS